MIRLEYIDSFIKLIDLLGKLHLGFVFPYNELASIALLHTLLSCGPKAVW